ILLALYSIRHLRSSHQRWGVWASRAIVMVMGVWMLSPIAERLRNPFMVPETQGEGLLARGMLPSLPMEMRRQRIKSDLDARGGNHIVIVGYAWHDTAWIDWAYNEADMDSSKIIWARDMGYLKNKELLDSYPNRQAWYVDRD